MKKIFLLIMCVFLTGGAIHNHERCLKNRELTFDTEMKRCEHLEKINLERLIVYNKNK